MFFKDSHITRTSNYQGHKYICSKFVNALFFQAQTKMFEIFEHIYRMNVMYFQFSMSVQKNCLGQVYVKENYLNDLNKEEFQIMQNSLSSDRLLHYDLQ